MSRLAVVGGATSGLGQACAHALAAQGYRLLIWSRSEDRLAATEASLRAAGAEVGHVVADASAPDSAEIVARAAAEAGGADVVVLNAGGPPPVDPAHTDPEQWRAALQLLAVTPIDLATRLLGPMRERRFGRIIAIASSGIREPIPTLAYSNSGRAALAVWLKTVSAAVAADGVTVNTVMPGRIQTPRIDQLDSIAAGKAGEDVSVIRDRSAGTIPAGRYGKPEEFAALVGFLASDAASYLTGQAIAVDGGMLRGW